MRFMKLTIGAVAAAVFTISAAFAGESTMGGMDHGQDMAASQWTTQDDAAFLYGMIAHHKGALDMSKPIVDSTRDADVRRWAQGIVASQQKEIDLMESLAARLNLRDEGGAGEMMRREMQAMMDHRVSDNADTNFVAMMIPHHAGAVDMSLPALVESDNREIRTLARDIIAAQAGEIYEFRQWLDAKGFSPRQ